MTGYLCTDVLPAPQSEGEARFSSVLMLNKTVYGWKTLEAEQKFSLTKQSFEH